MVATVVVVVATHNLAIGVVVGVLVAMVDVRPPRRPPRRGHRDVDRPRRHATAVYAVTGELFFASSNDLVTQFDYADDPDQVVIDLSASHIWDASTVAALDAITTKYAAQGQDRRDHRPEPLERRAPRTPLRLPAEPLTRPPRGESGSRVGTGWPVMNPDRARQVAVSPLGRCHASARATRRSNKPHMRATTTNAPPSEARRESGRARAVLDAPVAPSPGGWRGAGRGHRRRGRGMSGGWVLSIGVVPVRSRR